MVGQEQFDYRASQAFIPLLECEPTIKLKQEGAMIRTVAVVGLGEVGAGIAQVCAGAGFETIVRERDARSLWESLARIDHNLQRLVQIGCLAPKAKRALQERFIPVQNLWRGMARADLIIEAIDEDLDAKRRLWRELADRARPDALLATTSAGIPPSTLSDSLLRPDRAIGLRFLAPVTVMDTVEVVWTPETCLGTVDRAVTFVQALCKTPLCRSAEPQAAHPAPRRR